MNRRMTCLVLATLAGFTASPHDTAASASPPTTGVEILVGGAPLRRYAHDGRWYVEAIKGREYAIQLRNPYGTRVAVALSVDGLNTIDARETSAAGARKWVLDPYQTVTISGWQTSRTDARRFEFTTEERSYGQALGRTANLGVISAAFFRERITPIARELRTDDRPRESAPAEPTAPAPAQEASAARRGADDEYAATGMGRRTGHAVTEVRIDLEDAPAQTVTVRYEFRPQLVRLGILSPERRDDPLARRERSRGFEPGFAPEPR